MGDRLSGVVVVLGMHRSGTSMIAGALYNLGIDMGKDLLGKMPSNPLGHFEDKEFIKLNERILRAAGGRWNFPPGMEEIMGQRERFNKEIKELTAKFAAGMRGWKDPRTCLTIFLFVDNLINPYFIDIHRPAEEVAESLKKRDLMSPEKGLKLHSIYEQRIEEFYRLYPDFPRLRLVYHQVRQEPEQSVKKIIEFLKIMPDTEQVKAAVNFIKPE